MRDDKAGADRTDAQAEEQEALITLHHGHAEHRQRTYQQQPGIGLARAVTVAQRTDQQAHQYRHRHRGDIDIGDLRHA